MKIVRNDTVIDAVSYAYSQNVDIDVQTIDQGSLMLIATDGTGAAKTFISTDVTALTNIITIASHGFITGQKVA